MPNIVRLLLACFVVLLSACGSITAIPTDYKGPSAGKVAVGIGTLAGGRYQSYTLLVRKALDVSEKPSEVAFFSYKASGMFGGEKSDYEGKGEYGVVVVGSLPEGDYVLYNFNVFQNSGSYQANYSSRTPISVPFTVKSGTIAYLGNYQASALTGKNLVGMSVSAGAYFTVEDRMESQRSIALRKSGAADLKIVNFTPAPAELKNPFFVTPAERDRRIQQQ